MVDEVTTPVETLPTYEEMFDEHGHLRNPPIVENTVQQYMVGVREQLGEFGMYLSNARIIFVQGNSFTEEQLKLFALGRWQPHWRVFKLVEVPFEVQEQDVSVKGFALTLAGG